MSLTLTARNADLADMRRVLEEQQTRKIDVVAPAQAIRSEGGMIRLKGTDVRIDDDGVTPTEGLYRPTRVFDEGVAAKLKIPLAYLRRLRTERPDLYDANVNGLLHGRRRRSGGQVEWVHEPDDRSFLVRGFSGEGDEPGVARALLSDRYRVMDYLDVLVAALDGVRQSGIDMGDVRIEATDLTERRMYVKVHCPQVKALAPVLLEKYRSPFTGDLGSENPTVFGGFVFSNSEVGAGRLTVVPRLHVLVCKNGLQITKDAMAKTHLGGQMDEGVVTWSGDTQEKNLALVTAQVRDAVSTFLDVEYVKRKIADIEQAAGVGLGKPKDVVETVTQRLKFTQEHADGVFDMFLKSGDTSAGGVAGAVTAYAQTVEDADDANEIEAQALDAMWLAASIG